MSKGMIPQLVNIKSPATLYLYVLLYGLYLMFFPMFVPTLETAYSLVLLIFVFTASLFWGMTGGLIILASVFVFRVFTTIYLYRPYYGGPFAPILGLASVLIIGGLSDYVKTLESRLREDHASEAFEDSMPRPFRSTVVKDTVILIFICVITLSISSHYDLMESYYRFSQRYELHEIDEYIILLFILVIYAGIYSYRRWRDLHQELINRHSIEQELQRSETRYKSIVNNANEGIGVFRGGKTLFVNPYALQAMGFSENEMLSKSFIELIHPEDREMAVQYHLDRLAGKAVPEDYLVRLINKDDKILSTRVNGVTIDWEGKPATLNFLKDVTDIVRAEDDLRKALQEKDILLKEIHHRVKNNMQIISSLLNLQISRETNADVIGPLKESQNRVFAMALVHEQLYRNESFARINLAQYLEKLIIQLSSSFTSISKPEIIPHFEPDLSVSLNQAIPCGLVMNEMVTNALKHGYPDNRTGKIHVNGQRTTTGSIEISVKDDGVGLPESFDPEQAGTLGLSLILGLVRSQLDGTVTVESDHGTKFTIAFTAEGE